MPIRIILADDAEVVRKTLSRFLAASDEIDLVAEAGDVPEAVQMLGALKPDVLVFDLNMAIRGTDRCDQLKKVGADTVLVAISFAQDDEARALADRCGATCLVDKLKLHDDLIPMIVRCAAQRSNAADFRSPSVS
jgi:DNA-binding NarL/FixJ family response regulator